MSLKNGTHNQKGFLYLDGAIKKFLDIKKNVIDLKKIYSFVKKIFNDKSLLV